MFLIELTFVYYNKLKRNIMPTKKYIITVKLESGREMIYTEYSRRNADSLMSIIKDRLNLTPTMEIIYLHS
jgi:hypothetical protein